VLAEFLGEHLTRAGAGSEGVRHLVLWGFGKFKGGFYGFGFFIGLVVKDVLEFLFIRVVFFLLLKRSI
jgi:hypothetical protein